MDFLYYKNLIKKNSAKYNGKVVLAKDNDFKIKDQINIKSLQKMTEEDKKEFKKDIQTQIDRQSIDLKEYPILIVEKTVDKMGRLSLIGLDEDGEPKRILVNQKFIQKNINKSTDMSEKAENQEKLKTSMNSEKKEAQELGLSYKEYLNLKSSGRLDAYRDKLNSERAMLGFDEYLEKYKIPKEVLDDSNPNDYDIAFENRQKIKALHDQLEKYKKPIPKEFERAYQTVYHFDSMFSYKLWQKGININEPNKEDVSNNIKYIKQTYQQLEKNGLKPGERSKQIIKLTDNPLREKNIEYLFEKNNIPETAFHNSKDAIPHYDKIMEIYKNVYKKYGKDTPKEFMEYIKDLREKKIILDKGEGKSSTIDAGKILGIRQNAPKEEVLDKFNKIMSPILKSNPNANSYEDLENDPKAKQIIDAFKLLTKKKFGEDALYEAWQKIQNTNQE